MATATTNTVPVEETESKLEAKDMPGALTQDWSYYFEWGNKDHEKWSQLFEEAEKQRQEESKRWRKFYDKVYRSDMGFYKKMTMFALNAIQLWALWKQFRQQKEIADRAYELADRQQKIAEEMYEFYKNVYLPHDLALNRQINDYFTNPYRPRYDSTGSWFESKMRNAFRRSIADATRCNIQHCRGFSHADLKLLAIEEAQAVGNARTGAYRYEELRKESRDNFWLDMRVKFIEVGRGIQEQGQAGIAGAFKMFNSFGADPGAALSQLLGTLSNTVGSIISSPTAPTGNSDPVGKPPSINYQPFFASVQQSGDLHIGKNTKVIKG